MQFIATRKIWRCKDCKRQFTVKVGTIFEDSPIPFTKWLPAIWFLANTKNGTSSHELGRALGVTQKTAWFMLHRVRESMKDEGHAHLSGTVEADETYVGAKTRRGNIGSRPSGIPRRGPRNNKTIILGMIQRRGRVRGMVIPNDKAGTIIPIIESNVEFGSTMYTDAHRAYYELPWNYHHEFVNHMVTYVQGRVHTNTIENFWSCLKRTLHGTYIAARPFHMQAYVDEQVWRFNTRHGNDGSRFAEAYKRTDGRRLTYKALTTSHPIWRLKPGRAARSPLSQPPVPPQV